MLEFSKNRSSEFHILMLFFLAIVNTDASLYGEECSDYLEYQES
jgi:hypothetical protein